MTSAPPAVRNVAEALARHGYLPDEGLATAVYLAMKLRRPLLLEGEAGVGKTEVAKVLSRWTNGELIRLQCYEGIDVGQAVYEWDYSRQLLHLRAAEASGEAADAGTEALEHELYNERFLVKRALLQAIAPADGPSPILLIDEVDRADDEFEAFLLEVLSDFQITIPELGTFRAERPPFVILTSNRTATSTTRSSAVACTTGWSTRASSGRWRSSAYASPRSKKVWRVRWPRRSRPCAVSSSTSPRGWPRPSTGPPPSAFSARASSPRRRWPRRSAPCSSTARIRSGCASTAWPIW